MRKFNFIVIDDKPKNDEGWYRIFEYVLINNDYLVPGSIKEELLEAKQPVLQKIESSKATAMNYTVLSSETGFDFNSSRKYLIQHEKDFDFFFIDIDLRSGGFLKDARISDSYLEQYPELTGFQFIRYLPPSKRPIFYFSGAKAGRISDTLMNLRFWGDRLSDVYFGKIEIPPFPEDQQEFAFEEPTNFINQIYNRLDGYMYSVQFEVCSRLDISLSNILRSIIRKNDIESFDEPKIPCPYKSGDYWSLRTLFPKQTNKIELDRSTAETHRWFILDMLQTDWRILMCHFVEPKHEAYHGLLRHPENIKHIDKLLEAVEQSELTETKKVPDWHYIPVTKLPEYEAFKMSVTQKNGGSVNHSQIVKRLNQEILKQTSNDPTWKEVNRAETKFSWAEHYGILPTDILHIHKIARNNAETHHNELAEFKFREINNRSAIVFEWFFTNPFSTSLQMERRVFKFIEKVDTLFSAGLPDIGILACVRYKGKFELFEPDSNKKITIQYTQGNFNLDGDEEIEYARGYRIIIQSPNHVQIQNPHH